MNELESFLYVLRPRRPDMLSTGHTEEEMQVIGRHANYLRDLTDQKIVVLAGHTENSGDDTFGLVVLYADSRESAAQIMGDDPAVKEDVLTAELHDFSIAMLAEN